MGKKFKVTECQLIYLQHPSCKIIVYDDERIVKGRIAFKNTNNITQLKVNDIIRRLTGASPGLLPYYILGKFVNGFIGINIEEDVK